jgi:hypothetical protein
MVSCLNLVSEVIFSLVIDPEESLGDLFLSTATDQKTSNTKQSNSLKLLSDDISNKDSEKDDDISNDEHERIDTIQTNHSNSDQRHSQSHSISLSKFGSRCSSLLETVSSPETDLSLELLLVIINIHLDPPDISSSSEPQFKKKKLFLNKLNTYSQPLEAFESVRDYIKVLFTNRLNEINVRSRLQQTNILPDSISIYDIISYRGALQLGLFLQGFSQMTCKSTTCHMIFDGFTKILDIILNLEPKKSKLIKKEKPKWKFIISSDSVNSHHKPRYLKNITRFKSALVITISQILSNIKNLNSFSHRMSYFSYL